VQETLGLLPLVNWQDRGGIVSLSMPTLTISFPLVN
jgi:hypothetical protein